MYDARLYDARFGFEVDHLLDVLLRVVEAPELEQRVAQAPVAGIGSSECPSITRCASARASLELCVIA